MAFTMDIPVVKSQNLANSLVLVGEVKTCHYVHYMAQNM